MSAREILNQVAAEVKTCTKCKLYQSARNGVPGEGPVDAEILFIGEGPGFYEDQQGRPFVGIPAPKEGEHEMIWASGTVQF